jgi:hypothetical protein
VTSTACASTFEQNHLCPVSRHVPSPFFRATVSFAPTSEPPERSVRNIPPVQSVAGSVDVRCGTTRMTCSCVPWRVSTRATPSVMHTGQ